MSTESRNAELRAEQAKMDEARWERWGQRPFEVIGVLPEFGCHRNFELLAHQDEVEGHWVGEVYQCEYGYNYGETGGRRFRGLFATRAAAERDVRRAAVSLMERDARWLAGYHARRDIEGKVTS